MKNYLWKHNNLCWANTIETFSSVSLKEKKCCKLYSHVNPLSTHRVAFLAMDSMNDAWILSKE